MLIKILGFVLLTGAGALLGYRQSQHYKKREQLLSEVVRLCDSMINDITYFQPTLSQMLKSRFDTFPMLGNMLERYIALLDNKITIDHDVLLAHVPKEKFNDEEYMLFIQLLDFLGKSDSLTQRGGILSLKEAFLIKQNTAIEESKKYGNLFFKLGVLGGLAAGVIVL